MKQHKKILLLLCLFMTAITSHAASNDRVTLWGPTFYNMTTDEVFHNIAGAKRLNSTDSLTTDKVAKDLVMLDNVVISREKFNVILIFKNNLLKEVQLTLIPNLLSTNFDLYSNLLWVLSIKYGSPVKSTRQDFSPPTTTWQTQWIKNMINIDLFSDKNNLQIKYSAQYFEDLKNL